MKITLAKALKLKNKLVKEAADHLSKVEAHNSYLSTNPPNFDVQAEYKAYRLSLDKLAFLKAEIAKANGPIHIHIVTMAETKGMINHLRSINTRKGKETVGGGYNQPLRDIEYLASFSDKEIDAIIKEAEKDIESRQEEIDKFNHSTSIDVE